METAQKLNGFNIPTFPEGVLRLSIQIKRNLLQRKILKLKRNQDIYMTSGGDIQVLFLEPQKELAFQSFNGLGVELRDTTFRHF